ncbi:MAG: AraC family transcriptional regulator [Desulfobacteraceae bacterium]|nr:AraC family transcriptional regulator [Desulfobacteraceae bacterium]
MKKESVIFYHPADMQHISAVSGSSIINAFPRHVHSTFCIGIIDKGSRIISHKGTSAVIPENSMFVINPGESHTCSSGEKHGHAYRIICADEHIMRSIASQISEKSEGVPYFKNILIPGRETGQDIRQFFSLIDRQDSTMARESAVMSLLSGLILRYAENLPVPCQVGHQRQAVREYIEGHYAENLSLAQLARTACLSQFHFQRVFLKDTAFQ